MKKELTQREKRRAERKAKKQNFLQDTLQSLTQRQKDLPNVNVLKKALETLHQLPEKTEEYQELEKMLSV
ncbi:hypothetical protein QUF54_06815, partial [Candidatus Marithioploca araucensis]|nr:hypothetical protein [Candidatus Marithioploca araucensis]